MPMAKSPYHQPGSERGHTIVVVFAALVVVAAGIASWQYVQSKQNSAKLADVALDGKPSQLATDQDLTIKEWGIRFQLPATLQGDIYYKTFTNTLGEHSAVFASKRLDGMVGDKSCTFDGSAGASGLSAILSRLDPQNPGQFTLDYYRSQRTYLTSVNSFEYYSVNAAKDPPVTCLTGKHEEFNDIEQSISAELKQAFKTIQAVKE